QAGGEVDRREVDRCEVDRCEVDRGEVDRQGRPGQGRAQDPPGQDPERRRRRKAGRQAEAARHEEGRVDPMAHKKAGSSSKNGRDSVGQRLGVKVGDGQLVPAGSIIVRQRGMTFLAGTGAGLGRDYTVFATTTGKVKFEHATKNKKRVRVEAASAPIATAAAKA